MRRGATFYFSKKMRVIAVWDTETTLGRLETTQ
jgi:hypothetical protein